MTKPMVRAMQAWLFGAAIAVAAMAIMLLGEFVREFGRLPVGGGELINWSLGLPR